MKIAFACPSCAATGSVDAEAAGRSARCRHCGHRFTIPSPRPEAAETEDFALAEPAEGPAGDGYAIVGGAESSTFAPTRGAEPPGAVPRPSGKSATRTRARRAERRARLTRLAWAGGAFALAVAVTALFAPLAAACALMIVGCALILVGFGVGAYGAFSEDFLYGFLYLVIPLYTAYYMVTRWDDL